MSDSSIKKPRVTTKIFVERAVAKHGNRYDYSQSVYVSYVDKIKIICREHGEFYQQASNHINGNGCQKCSKLHRRSKCEILELFNKIHKNKYDYSIVDFKSMTKKVTIICLNHGYFKQTPASHAGGSGCPKCSGVARLNQDEILQIFKLKHGSRYDYSDVLFNGMECKVSIICRVHGTFMQTPYGHSKGRGCNKCGHIKQSRVTTRDHNYFLITANKVHGKKYDYKDSIYLGIKNKIKILCKTHGVFSQLADIHLRGSGCPKCSDENRVGFRRNPYIKACNISNNGLSNLYVIKMFSNSEVFYKIGITCNSVKLRFSGMKEYKYIVEHFISGDAGYIWDLEKSIHRVLFKYKYKPMCFFEGHTECFSKISKDALILISRIESTDQLQLIA